MSTSGKGSKSVIDGSGWVHKVPGEHDHDPDPQYKPQGKWACHTCYEDIKVAPVPGVEDEAQHLIRSAVAMVGRKRVAEILMLIKDESPRPEG